MSAVSLNYQRSGQGAPLVIVHGLFGSLSNWRSIARRLEGEFDVVVADLRNHGDSPHTDAMDYLSMAEDLALLIRARFGDQHVSVVGHSMGGKAMMTLALSHPELVSRLVAVDVAPVAYGKSGLFESYLNAMKRLSLDIASRREADAELAQTVPEPPIRAFLLQNIRRRDDRWEWRVNLDAIGANLHTIRAFPDFEWPATAPARFIRGALSDYITEDHHAAIDTLFPRADIVTIEQAGHWVHAQFPDQVAAQIADFCG